MSCDLTDNMKYLNRHHFHRWQVGNIELHFTQCSRQRKKLQVFINFYSVKEMF